MEPSSLSARGYRARMLWSWSADLAILEIVRNRYKERFWGLHVLRL